MNKTKQSKRKIKLCFVALGAYPLLAGRDMGFAGGSSVQQVLLAEELVKHNFDVSFITYTNGQEHIEDIGSIRVIKVYKREDASTRSFLVKAGYIWNAMKEEKVDIYFHESGAAGVVPLFCCLMRKRFVRYISSDAEVDKKEMGVVKWIDRIGNWLDIKLADTVIAQTKFQRKMLKENFSRYSIIIKNAFPLSNQTIPEKFTPPIVLWVSTIRKIKQPELFLNLAEAIPEGSFQMVGGAEDNNPALYDNIKEKAYRIPNLHFVGFVPFHEIDKYFEQASIFVNTSEYEGFPNTFIQAWMHYVPVVSLNVDPDALICKNKMGLHSKKFDQLVEGVKTLLKDKQLREEMSKNARQYVEREHDIKKIVKKYAEIFENVKQ